MIKADKMWENNECKICNLLDRFLPRKKRHKEKTEQHHIGGRKNFPDTLPLCESHHNILSEDQLKWLSDANNESERLSCYFYGLGDLSHLLWTETKLPFFLEAKRKLVYKAWDLRNTQWKRGSDKWKSL